MSSTPQKELNIPPRFDLFPTNKVGQPLINPNYSPANPMNRDLGNHIIGDPRELLRPDLNTLDPFGRTININGQVFNPFGPLNG